MTNVSEWSTSAGSNNSAPPDGWPENMLPGKVNDCARENMSALAKLFKDQNGSLVTAGTTTAYTLTTNCLNTAISDVPVLVFRVHAANTGAATLNVDGLGAHNLIKAGGTALTAGELQINQLLCVAYNNTLSRFDIIGPEILQVFTAAQVLASLLTVDGAGSGLDADLFDGLNSTAFLKVANNLSDLASAATAFATIKQAATSAATGVVELADQSEMEAATDTTRAVVPSVVKNHPGVAKAWVKWQVNGTIDASYNVTSVTDNGAGDWTVNFTVPFSSANYVVVGAVGTQAVDGRQFNQDSANTPTASACRILAVNPVGDDAADPIGTHARMYAASFGDQ